MSSILNFNMLKVRVHLHIVVYYFRYPSLQSIWGHEEEAYIVNPALSETCLSESISLNWSRNLHAICNPKDLLNLRGTIQLLMYPDLAQ